MMNWKWVSYLSNVFNEIDHLQDPVTDVRVGAVTLQPRVAEDAEIERLIEEYLMEEELPPAIRWPTQDPQPINEYTTDGYMTMAFPCLYPYGRADFCDQSQKHTKLSTTEYFDALLRYHDGRFGSHPRYGSHLFECLSSDSSFGL
jgi:hypothetical protein